jgi:hypothetical protein
MRLLWNLTWIFSALTLFSGCADSGAFAGDRQLREFDQGAHYYHSTFPGSLFHPHRGYQDLGSSFPSRQPLPSGMVSLVDDPPVFEPLKKPKTDMEKKQIHDLVKSWLPQSIAEVKSLFDDIETRFGNGAVNGSPVLDDVIVVGDLASAQSIFVSEQHNDPEVVGNNYSILFNLMSNNDLLLREGAVPKKDEPCHGAEFISRYLAVKEYQRHNGDSYDPYQWGDFDITLWNFLFARNPFLQFYYQPLAAKAMCNYWDHFQEVGGFSDIVTRNFSLAREMKRGLALGKRVIIEGGARHEPIYAFAEYKENLARGVGYLYGLAKRERQLHAATLWRNPTAQKTPKHLLLEQLVSANNLDEFAAAGRACYEQCAALIGPGFASYLMWDLGTFPIWEALQGVSYATIVHRKLWTFSSIAPEAIS